MKNTNFSLAVAVVVVAFSFAVTACSGAGDSKPTERPVVKGMCPKPLVTAWITQAYGEQVVEDLEKADAEARSLAEHAKSVIDSSGCIALFNKLSHETKHELKITLIDFRLQKVGFFVSLFKNVTHRLVVYLNVELNEPESGKIVAVDSGVSDQYIKMGGGFKGDIVSFYLTDPRVGEAIKEATAEAAARMIPRVIERLGNGTR